LEDLILDGRNTLKLIFKKQYVRMRKTFIWLSTGSRKSVPWIWW